MDVTQILYSQTAEIEAKLGYVFKNKDLLTLAFVHRSFVNEYRGFTQHNERLEFLGDSVLNFLMAEYLYGHYPSKPEGELSTFRSRLVEASACSTYLQMFGIEEYLLMGKGERQNEGRGRQTILADLFEAIVGAIYLDGGLEATRAFIFGHLTPVITNLVDAPQRNWKALFQDLSQKKFQETPTYQLVSSSGPEHFKLFEIAVTIKGEIFGSGSGHSKKEAQQAAALDALQKHFPTWEK